MAINNEDKTVKNDLDLDFGFDAEYNEFDGYTTISGNEQTDVSNMTGYSVADVDIGNFVTGVPEVTIFLNNSKDENGNYIKNYQSVRIRLIDYDEYVDLYANIPRMDDRGFIHDLNRYQHFYRTGFDLCFSFMRFIDETNILDENGEINRINAVNIEKICKTIDQMEYAKIKIINGAVAEYPSWVILDLKNKV